MTLTQAETIEMLRSRVEALEQERDEARAFYHAKLPWLASELAEIVRRLRPTSRGPNCYCPASVDTVHGHCGLCQDARAMLAAHAAISLKPTPPPEPEPVREPEWHCARHSPGDCLTSRLQSMQCPVGEEPVLPLGHPYETRASNPDACRDCPTPGRPRAEHEPRKAPLTAHPHEPSDRSER